MDKLNVLIVDQSVINRKELSDIVGTTSYGNVLRNASNGQIGMEWLQQFLFDVILLDVSILEEMGTSYIQQIKKQYPKIEIIVISNLGENSAKLTLEAINIGAMDFVLRTDKSMRNSLEAIFTQIKVRQYLPPTHKEKKTHSEDTLSSTLTYQPRQVQKTPLLGDVDLVLIASSTGGPAALESLFYSLPMEFEKPILIVQHMPPDFTKVLAEAINKKYKVNISEGKTGDVIKPKDVIIAPGGFHMTVEEGFGKTLTVKLLDTPYLNGLKPAADILFDSIAKVCRGKNILIVVLTGMGNDGTNGIKKLRETCNCYCITQSEKTCVVYGMPKCVDEAGLSDEVVDLNNIGFRMYQIAHKRGGANG